jgi:hypothetical protein
MLDSGFRHHWIIDDDLKFHTGQTVIESSRGGQVSSIQYRVSFDYSNQPLADQTKVPGNDYPAPGSKLPEPIHITLPAIAQDIIAPEKQPVQPACFIDPPADPVVEQAGGLVKGTGPNAIRAIGIVIRPETETGFGIDVPGHDPLAVTNIVGCVRRLAKHDTLAGTFFGAFFTDQAKIPHTEFNRSVGNQR